VHVIGLKAGGFIGGFSGRGGKPIEPEEPIPEHPVAAAGAALNAF